jgi:bilirubin oxidase
MVEEGRETVIRVLNQGKRTASTHLHGMSSHAVWDGWAEDAMEIGEYKDYYYGNNEGARSIWYHDHAEGHTAADAFEGQAGVYIVYDPKDDVLGLPSGKYDIPLALNDKTYLDNGQLVSIEGIDTNFIGEMIQVNEQPWPYLEVEPRKYRFRIYDMSVSRPYDLYLVAEDGSWLDFEVIASDSGLFGHPVKTNDLTISMGERYEIVVDFASVRGQNITFANKLQNRWIPEFENTDKVMRFVVGNMCSDDSNNGPVPDVLNPDLAFPTKENQTDVDRVFNFQMGGDAKWTINGVAFSNPNARVLARPAQGTVELWEFRHTGGFGVHPVHAHLINMQVVSRSGGPRGLLPYETAGLKDVVFLQPGEVVHVLANYGPWNGVYMVSVLQLSVPTTSLISKQFHCHNLVHEDHEMMAAFNVTLLEELGYDFNSTLGYDDPDGNDFAPVAFNADAYEDAAKRSAVRSLGSLNAYQPASALIAAQSSYYAAKANQEGPATTSATQTPTVVPTMSVGEAFSSSVTSEALPGFEALETVNLTEQLGLTDATTTLGLDNATNTTSVSWQTLPQPTPSTTVAPSRK